METPFKSISSTKCANPGLCVAEKNKMLPHNVHQSNDWSLRFGFVFAAFPLLRKILAPKRKGICINKELGNLRSSSHSYLLKVFIHVKIHQMVLIVEPWKMLKIEL